MIVNNLTVEGFRIIGNKLSIDFPAEGKIGIYGHNESGKSSIFDAIEFALFGLSLRNVSKEDQITWGKDRLKVKLDFSSGEKDYRIERSLTQKGSHKVKFVQLNQGQPIESTEINNISSVEETVEEILGLDKDSYSKLIYIRQKELDALKELQKRDRTKLINKVMGIDIFDTATEKTKSDKRENEQKLESLQQKLELLKRNHDGYLEKTEEKKLLEQRTQQLTTEIQCNERIANELKSKIEQLEKSLNNQSTNNVIDLQETETLISEFEEAKTSKEIDEQHIELWEEIIPSYFKLKRFEIKFRKAENKQTFRQDFIEEQQQKIQKPVSNETSVRDKRSSAMKKGIILIVIGVMLTGLGVLSPILIIPGIVIVLLSIVYFRRYKKFDSAIIQDIGNQTILNQISENQKGVEKIMEELKKIRDECKLNSSEEVGLEIEKINSRISYAIEQHRSNLSHLNGTITQLDKDCKEFLEDYTIYPQESVKKDSINEEIRLLEFVIQQFGQVSERMRGLVIPQARTLINFMLPVITNNKYSDFDISEDLKFMVYTAQTGGYKERELFSGGTQDQFLIALRLAFTQSILDSRIRADEYCLFMDETISSSDEARKKGIFDLLEKANKTFKQIFIIAHEDISDVVEHHLILQSGLDGFTTIKSRSW